MVLIKVVMTGASLTVEAEDRGETVRKLKELIQAKDASLAPEAQRLSYKGTQLEDAKTLHDYGLDKATMPMIQLAPVDEKRGDASPKKQRPALKDDPRFKKYFKMLAMHLPRGAVEIKMKAEGVDPAILDMDPEKPMPGEEDEDEGPPLNDDPRYKKYFKMLAMHLPRGAVEIKMKAEGVDPAILDMDPNKPMPKKSKKGGPPLKEDPRFKKYFKMLAMHLPRGAVEIKMRAEGVDPAILDMDPDKPYDDGGASGKPALKEDPKYAKYFKMLKMHLPRGAVECKMRAEGVDPAILDCDPEKPLPSKFAAGSTSRAAVGKKAKPAPVKVKMKGLFWSKMKADEIKSTIWEALAEKTTKKKKAAAVNPLMAAIAAKKDASPQQPETVEKEEEDPMITALESRFCDPSVLKKSTGSSAGKVAKKKKVEKVLLLDAKRNQAVMIGLGRIKLPHDEVRRALISLDEKQLEDLGDAGGVQKWLTLVPTSEEYEKVQEYCTQNGGVEYCVHEKLGPAECFFATIGTVPRLVERLKALLAMRTFEEGLGEILKAARAVRGGVDQLSKASEPGSVLLEIMSMALKIGNRMNFGNKARGEAAGFRPDTLAKLSTVKCSNDPKLGTLVNFIVERVERSSSVSLELGKVKDAAAVNMEQTDDDFKRLDETIKTTVEDELADAPKNLPREFADPFVAKLQPFASDARRRLKVCSDDLATIRGSVESLAQRFGGQAKEGDSCPVQAFFLVYSGFVADIEAALAANKRLRDIAKREEQKRLAAEKKAKKKQEQRLKQEDKLKRAPSMTTPARKPPSGAPPPTKATPTDDLFDHFAREREEASAQDIAKRIAGA